MKKTIDTVAEKSSLKSTVSGKKAPKNSRFWINPTQETGILLNSDIYDEFSLSVETVGDDDATYAHEICIHKTKSDGPLSLHVTQEDLKVIRQLIDTAIEFQESKIAAKKEAHR